MAFCHLTADVQSSIGPHCYKPCLPINSKLSAETFNFSTVDIQPRQAPVWILYRPSQDNPRAQWPPSGGPELVKAVPYDGAIDWSRWQLGDSLGNPAPININEREERDPTL